MKSWLLIRYWLGERPGKANVNVRSEESVSASCDDFQRNHVFGYCGSRGNGCFSAVPGNDCVVRIGRGFGSGNSEVSGKYGRSVLLHVYLEVTANRKRSERNREFRERNSLGKPYDFRHSGNRYSGRRVFEDL